MYIHEAIKARTADKPFIIRTSWNDELGPCSKWTAKIMPSNTPDCCLIVTTVSANGKTPCRGWQPTAGDLIAEDWEPTA